MYKNIMIVLGIYIMTILIKTEIRVIWSIKSTTEFAGEEKML